MSGPHPLGVTCMHNNTGLTGVNPYFPFKFISLLNYIDSQPWSAFAWRMKSHVQVITPLQLLILVTATW